MASYNCAYSTNNAYGAGNFGTCTSTSVGAPNTGTFTELLDGGSFTILVPLAVTIVVVVIASVAVKLRKKAKTTDA